jgi:hypothetical protein
VICGEDDPALLDSHHIAGWRNDGGAEGPLCFNCHRKVTERLRRAGVTMTEPNSPLDRLVAILGGVAELLFLIAGRFKGWAIWLSSLMTALDVECPTWRTVMATIPPPIWFEVPR